MTNTFSGMTTRIATELRRTTGFTGQIRNAINDAIGEASVEYFYFNEVRGYTFSTVAQQEEYDDMSLAGIDNLFLSDGAQRTAVTPVNNDALNLLTNSSLVYGRPEAYSRVEMKIRFYPIPERIYAVYVDAYARLTPYPLAADADTNAWLVEGERYIRALAKRNFLRDIVHDHKEAAIYDAIASDERMNLVEATTARFGTGRVTSTQW